MGIVFSQVSDKMGGAVGNYSLSYFSRNRKMFIFGSNIGWLYRFTTFCDLDLTFDFATVTFKILSRLYIVNRKV